LVIVDLQSNNNQSGFGKQRKKFVLLSASHFTRVFTPTTSISGPDIHVGAYVCASFMFSYFKNYILYSELLTTIDC